jgi:hypothetical protein
VTALVCMKFWCGERVLLIPQHVAKTGHMQPLAAHTTMDTSDKEHRPAGYQRRAPGDCHSQHLQHDFADMVALFHSLMRLCCVGERENTVNDWQAFALA